MLGLAISSVRLIAATAPYAQMYIDRTCDQLGSDYEYVLYTYPENTNDCITIGAPGFPFFSTDAVTQCGDYTDGGEDSTDCNNYPRNSPAYDVGGADMTCYFWTSEDCGISGGDDVWNTVPVTAAGSGCTNFVPQVPFSGGSKQTASSFACH